MRMSGHHISAGKAGLFLVVVLGASGCPQELPPLDLKEGCQPLLAGFDCMLPYPSDHFLVVDSSLPSGRRVQMGRAAALLTKDGYSADINDFRPSDGFSIAPPIVAVLGKPLDDAGLVGIFDDYNQAARIDSPTLIIEADSGKLIPHFVDLDPRATDPTRRALVLRPMELLNWQTRYVVALQGLRGPDGERVPAPEGFRRIRDGEEGADPQLADEAVRLRRDVLSVLEDAGVEIDGLQLAWDFSTGSEAHRVSDMLRARELALAHLAQHPPELISIGMVEDEHDNLWRKVVGKLRGPMVIEHDGPGADLLRDAQGRVRIDGSVDFGFTVMIPTSVRDSFEPGRTLQFGHGFFGSQSEVEGAAARHIIHALRTTTFAIDWWGMSAVDIGVVVATVGDEVYRSMDFADRVVQAMVNWLTLSAALSTVFPDAVELSRPADPGLPGVVEDPQNPGQNNAGQLLFDPAHYDFLGISMGHILGGIYTALNPDLQRAVLHAGGAAFTQMMFRAQPFERFLFVMELPLPDPLDHQKLAASMQMQFDRIDPATYARFVLRDELPQGPAGQAARRRVLMQCGVGDSHVPNFSSYFHARMLGVPLLAPSARQPWGMQSVDPPLDDGSAMVVYDMGIDDSFAVLATPPEVNFLHGTLRFQPQVVEQMDRFLRTGSIVDTCWGSCVLPGP